MHAPISPLLVAMALAGVLAPARAAAQASPYIPLDDPRLPLLEHLIARGEVEDPSPMVRPFRRVDAIRVLAASDSSGDASSKELVQHLREEFGDPAGNRWRIEVRAGGQAYSHARRELLHPAGPDGVRPYFELGAEARFGSVLLVTRPIVEPRLTRDPDWPGRRDVDVAGRMADAYLSAQF